MIFGRKQYAGFSPADMAGFKDILKTLIELRVERDTFEAEAKMLREDRDTWKALALKLSGA